MRRPAQLVFFQYMPACVERSSEEEDFDEEANSERERDDDERRIKIGILRGCIAQTF